MKRINCWEYMKCGREPGGKNSKENGVCPAAADASFEGINRGKCAGRFCWAVAGTLCGNQVQGTFADKRETCLNCRFYQKVRAEEGTANLRTKFLRFVTPHANGSLLSGLPSRTIEKGKRFITQGESCETAYIVKRGTCLEIVEKDGRFHPVGHRSEGDIVGMISLLTGEPGNWHVEAETEMEVWVIHKSRLEKFSENDPELLLFFTEIVADRFDSRRPIADRTIGKYLAMEIIGRGGYSIVYKGIHTGLRMPVAIKMMRHNLALETDFLKTFRNEARIIAGLNHENIIKVFDIEERYRTVFVITEFLDGESLNDMLERLGRISPIRAARILQQLCSALDHAWHKGLVHRDINPRNVMIMPGDRVKLIDFGLACPPGTDDWLMGGAFYYLAPELFDGEPADARSDIFALGITAYEIVTGEKPFPTNNVTEWMKLIRTRDIPDLGERVPNLPPFLHDFIMKATKHDPSDRYQNPGQVWDALSEKKNHQAGQPAMHGKKRITMHIPLEEEENEKYNYLMEKIQAMAREAGISIDTELKSD